MSLAHYIFVRRDLPIGVITSMVTHAAGDSASTRMWPLPPHTIAVVLEAKDEDHLKDISGYLRANKVEFIPVVESSEPYANQLMALGLIPVEREKVSEILKEFQTLKTCKEG